MTISPRPEWTGREASHTPTHSADVWVLLYIYSLVHVQNLHMDSFTFVFYVYSEYVPYLA